MIDVNKLFWHRLHRKIKDDERKDNLIKAKIKEVLVEEGIIKTNEQKGN